MKLFFLRIASGLLLTIAILCGSGITQQAYNLIEANGTPASIGSTLNFMNGTGVTWSCSTSGVVTTCTASASGVSFPTSAHVIGTNGSAQPVAATATDDAAILYVAGAGTAQAQTVTLAPAVTSLTNGLLVRWLPGAANTATAPTLAVNGLAAKPITALGATALVANDLTTTAIAVAIYDGTEFQLQNPQITNSSALPASANVLGTNSSSQGVAATATQIVAPLVCYDSTVGHASAFVCNTTPTFTPVTGSTVLFRFAAAANSSASMTINVNGLGVAALRPAATGGNLNAGTLLGDATQINYYLLTYDSVTPLWVIQQNPNGQALWNSVGAGATINGLISLNSITGQTNISANCTNGGTGNINIACTGSGSFGSYKSATACASSASPAVCAAAPAGFVTIAAGATTVTVNTTAVTANSQILLIYDSSLGTALGVTCNATEPALYGVTARVAATSFTITATAPITNPACFSYVLIN